MNLLAGWAVISTLSFVVVLALYQTCGHTPAKGSDHDVVEGDKNEIIVQQTKYDILSLDNSDDAMNCECDCFEALGLDVLELGFLGCVALGILTAIVKLVLHLKKRYLKRQLNKGLKRQKAEFEMREQLKQEICFEDRNKAELDTEGGEMVAGQTDRAKRERLS